MANHSQWYYTQLPSEIVSIIENETKFYQNLSSTSALTGNTTNLDIRKSLNSWIPTSNWIGGMLWYYVERANRENFLYDITGFHDEVIQYTVYEEGQFYNWHTDHDLSLYGIPSSTTTLPGTEEQKVSALLLNTEPIRKLSISVQLSDPEDYTGGQLQFVSETRNSFFAPKTKGTVIVFDSRTTHRVRKITSGVRKSLVGWAVGPRWR
jgi:PKHD-type hydroxylase